MKDQKTLKIAQTALFAALSYVAFRFLKIPLPVPGAGAIHIGNAFLVLCALLLGGVYGGIAGSFGMTIADLTDPAYVTSAPKTFIMKFCIGLIVGFIAHRIAHLSQDHPKQYQMKWVLISSGAGFLFNILVDPPLGYLYKRFILGIPADVSSIVTKWTAGATFINAVVSMVLVTVIYMALRPVLLSQNLFLRIGEEKAPEST